MKNLFHKRLYEYTRILELLVSIAIVIAIGISMISMIEGLKQLFADPIKDNGFQKFLGIAFNTLIGVEFLKMLLKNNVGTVIEVLLFAIARQLIVEHTNVYENCVGIVAIAILFIIRKYLFIPDVDFHQ